MESSYLPQELIDMTISHIEDHKTLASLRLVSSPCRRSAEPLYFKQLFIMLSGKSVANIADLIQSPYREYVEEIYWADKELQYQLQNNFEAFQDAFGERLAGLSTEAAKEWHKKYRTMYKAQEDLYFPLYVGSTNTQYNLESFINLKRVSVNNGCEIEAVQKPFALKVKAHKILEHPAPWSTPTQCRPQRGHLYVLILESLATTHNITHLSIKTEGRKWEAHFMSPGSNGARPQFAFKSIQHLDIDLCLWEALPYEQRTSPRVRLSKLGEAPNLQSLTFKTHYHDVDELGKMGRPLRGLQGVNRHRPVFTLQPTFYPQLRHLELHCFSIPNRRLVECVDTLQHSMRSLVLSHCVFHPSLSDAFTEIRGKKVVPSVAIFKHSKDGVFQPAPAKPCILTERAITPYLVWRLGLSINGSLSLHDWDKQIEEYMDQNSGNTEDASTQSSDRKVGVSSSSVPRYLCLDHP